jgi:maltose O-acetyltransferase
MTPGADEASEKEMMLAGEPYDPFDPVLVRDRDRARELTRRFDETLATDPAARQALLEKLFGSIGPDATVEPPFRCDYGYRTTARRSAASLGRTS